jgi:hypothetical protein
MRRFLLLAIVFLALVACAPVSQVRAGIISSVWGPIDAQQDEDGELVLTPSGAGYALKPSSGSLSPGDLLVGGVNFLKNQDGNQLYGTNGLDNFNLLFMSEVDSVTPTGGTTTGGIPLSSYSFVAPSVSQWATAASFLGLPSIADKTSAGGVAVVYSNPNQGPAGAFSYSNPGTIPQAFNYIWGNGASGGTAGTRVMGELGFTGGTTSVNGVSLVGPNSTGEGWTAIGPTSLAGLSSILVGNGLPGTTVTVAVDPTAGYLTTLPLAPLPTTFGSPGADFLVNETISGTLGANQGVFEATSGGNGNLNLVPEPNGILLVVGLMGLWAGKIAAGRRMRKA